MADYTGDDEEQPSRPAGMMPPAMQQFVDTFTDPAAQKWAGEVATRLHDYTTKRQIADDNIAAGNNFIADMDGFKSGLIQMVKADPHAMHVAMDIVPPTIHAMISTLPNVPEGAQDHHDAIVQHMQQEIASAAITNMAERHEGLARGMLDDARVKDVLPEAHRAALGSYIDLQAQARAADEQAQMDRLRAQQETTAHQTSMTYLRALTDPATGALTFPPAWNQGVAADPALRPQDKAALGALYAHLNANGDTEASDPNTVSHFVDRLAAGNVVAPEILSHSGRNLRLNDALHLASLTGDRDPNMQGHLDGLAAAMSVGRDMIGRPENGPAGQAAYSRFVNWLLPVARAGAMLDPASPDYALGGNRLQQFAPTGNDAVAKALPASVSQPRRPLSDIFGGKRG